VGDERLGRLARGALEQAVGLGRAEPEAEQALARERARVVPVARGAQDDGRLRGAHLLAQLDDDALRGALAHTGHRLQPRGVPRRDRGEQLSGGPPRELLAAVAAGDAARLQAVPGIGKRTAERIVVELREKVGAAEAPIVVRRPGAEEGPRALAREGLLGLGFTPAEADGLLEAAPGDTAEALIAHALRESRASR